MLLPWFKATMIQGSVWPLPQISSQGPPDSSTNATPK